MTTESSAPEKNASNFRRIINILKKPIDSIDDIWLGISKIVKGLPTNVSAYLIGVFGFMIHHWEGVREAKEHLEEAENPHFGQRNSRVAAVRISQLFSFIGRALAIILICNTLITDLAGISWFNNFNSFLTDTIGFNGISRIGLFPFLISGFAAAIYATHLLRKWYSFHVEKHKTETDNENLYLKDKVIRDFYYGRLEICASAVCLYGLMLGTEGYFDQLKNLSGDALTENTGYIIIAGVVLGLVVKIFEDRAETLSQERFVNDYAAIQKALGSEGAANPITSYVPSPQETVIHPGSGSLDTGRTNQPIQFSRQQIEQTGGRYQFSK